MRISQRVEQRTNDGLKKSRRVVKQARDRAVNEAARGEPLARHIRGRVLWVGMELEGGGT